LLSPSPSQTGNSRWIRRVVAKEEVLCFFAGHRPPRTLTELLALRKERDAQFVEKQRVLRERELARVKARYDAHPGELLVWNVLVISGGGDDGAFGAGFLKGWSAREGHSLNRSLT